MTADDRVALADVLRAAVPEVASAAVALVAVDGRTVGVGVVGERARYVDGSRRLLSDRQPIAVDAIFDLASITKLFTTVVVLSLTDEGRLGLDDLVAAWLPVRRGLRDGITVRHLLTHTSGLPASRRVDGEPDDTRWELVLSTPASGPTGAYQYSDVGMIIAGRVAELAGGAPLDVLVRDRICRPLGLADTGYRPAAALRPRIVATEFKPERPAARAKPGPPGTPDAERCVRGQVHDETAYALGGVAGHAGLFATAGDLLRFGEMLRTGGAGGVVSPTAIAEMLRDQGVVGPAFRQALGVRIGDPAIVGPLTDAFGHSGFTGTSLVVDPGRRLTIVLLTNNVHPLRGQPGIRELRTAVAEQALRLARRSD